MNDKENNEIDAKIQLSIERTARAEANRARIQTTSLIGIVGLILTIGSYLGIDHLIEGHVEIAVEKEISKKIVETLEQLAEKRKQVVKDAEAIKEIRQKLENYPDMTTRRYQLELPSEASMTPFETDVLVEEYPATAISGWYLYNEGKSLCNSDTDVEIFMRGDLAKTWHLLIEKGEGCNRIGIRIIYIPKKWVSIVDKAVTLKKIIR